MNTLISPVIKRKDLEQLVTLIKTALGGKMGSLGGCSKLGEGGEGWVRSSISEETNTRASTQGSCTQGRPGKD